MEQELYVFIYLSKEDGYVPAGLIQYEESGRYSSSRFRYGEKYLGRHNAASIDPVQLPLENTTFITEEGFSVFNGIRDAGPDKWGRYLLDKKFGRGLTELEYIAAAGADRVGTLAFSNDLSGPKILTKEGYLEQKSKPLNLSLCINAIRDIEVESESEQLREYLQYGPSMGGARPKANVIWKNKLNLAKFSLSLDSRNEPSIEYATMTLAKKAGLNVPPVDKTEVMGKTVFLIERFDRSVDREPISFISGLTLTGNHESDYSLWSYHRLVDVITKYSSKINSDLTELFSRMIFNILVYNNDDHLRNFGFLSHQKDYWDLSPLYDVVPATVSTQNYSLAMIIGKEGKKASLTNALSMCERFRLSNESAMEIINKIQSSVKNWKKHFKKCGVLDSDILKLENSFLEKP